MNTNEQETQTSREQKVYNLNIELADVTNQKKSHVRAYNDEIKRIKSEIKELIGHELNTSNVS